MRILVTGASGFIGLPLIQVLAAEGHNVLALSRNASNQTSQLNVLWCEVDLSTHSTYRTPILEFSPEIVIHLAWDGIPNFSSETSKCNLELSMNFFSWLVENGKYEKFVVTGSCLEYGRMIGECTESDETLPETYFTWAKHSLRTWLSIVCKERNICLGWFRLFYVYGPGQRNTSLIPSILSSLTKGLIPKLRTPNYANDYIYISDVVRALAHSVDTRFPSGIYNVGTGTSTPVKQLYKTLKQITDSQTIENQEIISTELSSAEVNFWANMEKTENYLGWTPSTALIEGLNLTWKNTRRNYLK